MVIPGSHKGPVYDHHQDGRFCGAVTDSEFSAEDAVPVRVKAGGISIHHVRILHGSVANVSPLPRRLLLFMFCAIDAWPLKGILDYEAFNDTIVRGEPLNVPRLTDVPVRMPLPPPEKSGSIYESQTVLKTSTFRP